MKRFLIFLSLIIFSVFSCSMPFEEMLKLSSKEMIEYLAKGSKNARITVGIVQNDEMSFTVYGENGKKLPQKEYIYDIGSVSKVITGHLFAKAIHEKALDIEDTIDNFLDLPPKQYYPTLKRLLTHTSGYKYMYAYYYMPLKLAPYENPYFGITREMNLHHVRAVNLENKDYPFEYSNFGIGISSMVLEKVFEEDYYLLVNNYFYNLGLNNTRVGNGKGDLTFHYNWNNDNPLIAAGGIVSSVTDLMEFAKMQMDPLHPYAKYAHQILADNLDTGYDFPDVGLSTNAMGLGWHIDKNNGVIWHAGSVDTFDTYLGFNKDEGIAIVVLSNIRSRIHSWAIGSQLFKELL